jgi:DNA polymerase-4
MASIIVCVDMDAFFASVEQRDNPDLRGKPLAVTGAGERTVVATSSYEARARGVKTAMSVREAKRLCPELILVVGNHAKYGEICRQLEQICLRFTPDIEVRSIDEVFLDVTRSHHLFGGPVELAQRLKASVRSELGLTCTVGMGPNVLVAKLASDLAKPDGFRWIDETAVPAVFETLPVKKLSGIGRQTEEKLRMMGITACGQLGRAPLPLLVKRFGTIGPDLKAMGNGTLQRPLETASPEPKSIGHRTTLPEDIWKREELKACLLRLSEKVGRRARRYDYRGKKITLTVRYNDFETFSRQDTLPTATNETGEIYRFAVSILDKIELKKSVRLLGISLASLSRGEGQLQLFGQPDKDKKAALAKAVDAVNDKFGEGAVTHASTLAREEDQKVVSPARGPSGVRKREA